MAQIHSENLVITLSVLTKDIDLNRPVLITDELKSSIEAIAQELAGPGIVIEVQVA